MPFNQEKKKITQNKLIYSFFLFVNNHQKILKNLIIYGSLKKLYTVGKKKCSKCLLLSIFQQRRELHSLGDNFHEFNPLWYIPCLELRVLVKPLGFFFLLPCTILWSHIIISQEKKVYFWGHRHRKNTFIPRGRPHIQSCLRFTLGSSATATRR